MCDDGDNIQPMCDDEDKAQADDQFMHATLTMTYVNDNTTSLK